jgi:hypothetical protein
MNLIIYSKPDCCLCAGLLEKLEQIQDPNFNLGTNLEISLEIKLEIRDITTNLNWFEKYEVPVLCVLRENIELELPRVSPRSPARKLQEMLSRYV